MNRLMFACATVVFAGVTIGSSSPAWAEDPVESPGSANDAVSVIYWVDGVGRAFGYSTQKDFVTTDADARGSCQKETDGGTCSLTVADPNCVAMVRSSGPEFVGFGGVGPTVEAAKADALNRAAGRPLAPGESVAFCTIGMDVQRF